MIGQRLYKPLTSMRPIKRLQDQTIILEKKIVIGKIFIIIGALFDSSMYCAFSLNNQPIFSYSKNLY